MSQIATSEDVIDFWIGAANEDADAAKEKNKLWFQKSDETDAAIADQFGLLHRRLIEDRDYASEFVDQGPNERLAAIIVLDQFSRNMFRGSAKAFAQDDVARELAEEGLTRGADKGLSEAKRIFFYIPFEHSEAAIDQVRSIALFTALYKDSRAAFRPLVESTLEYAYAHKAVIDRFGRYPHRNAALGRASTPEELDWLAKGGGF